MKKHKTTKYNRNSCLIKIGRFYQQISKIFYPIDIIFQNFLKEKDDIPTIVLLAPPRSGSTLAYQVFTSGIKNFHLTNIWNLLYSTPTIGGKISQKICKDYKSSFNSQHGFVPGVCGEAEGLKFWSYWTGQKLIESNQTLKPEKTKKLYNILKKIKSNQEVFITGYLSHVFSIDLLNKTFPKIIFVHLKRDLLSNAYSLYKLSGQTWPSVKPKEIKNYKNISKHKASIIQLLLLHKKILEKTDNKNTIRISYRDVCNSPHKVIKKVIRFFKDRNITIYPKSKNNIPDKFNESVKTPEFNKDTKEIQKYLEEEINKDKFKKVKEFLNL